MPRSSKSHLALLLLAFLAPGSGGGGKVAAPLASAAAFSPADRRGGGRSATASALASPPGPGRGRPRSFAAPRTRTATTSATRLSAAAAPPTDFAPDLFDLTSGPLGTALVVLAALTLGIFAQSFINSMLEGERGLGAFLSDGSGYGKSGFKPRSGSGTGGGGDGDEPLGGPDPLPWLKLPELDFVEVAGQEKKGKFSAAPELRTIDVSGIPQAGELSPEEERRIVERLEDMAGTLRAELKAGNYREAEAIRVEIEGTMAKYGIRYEEGFQ